MNPRDLADFLRHRREALRPDEAGLLSGVRRRRTPGLRREEVAWLAGISTSYYERLEQARASSPSSQVLTSLSRALRLSEDERLHLARLAGHAPTAFNGPDGEVSDGVRLLLGRLGRVPAYVLNARYDVVAWNDAAAELFPDLPLLPPGRRNAMRMWMDPGETACGPPSEGEREPLRQVAADLRRAAARYPSDPELHQLIDDLMGQSSAFTAAWANHDVRALPTLRKRIEHPELGVFELDCQTLWIPGHDQRVVFYTAPPGSPDQAKLSRLGVGSLDKI